MASRSESDTRKRTARFPLVVFDLDGTLLDTRRWWPEVAARAVRALAAAAGLDLPVPAPEEAWRLVGLRDQEVFEGLLPREQRALWPELRALVLPLEDAVLRSGTDYTFPGTRELLEDLRAAGCALAIASNCGRRYLEAALEGQGLGRLVDRAFCLDDGLGGKERMLAEARAQLAPAAAPGDCVLVGDRAGDFEAARAAGFSFVLRAGFHGPGDLQAAACAATSAELGAILLGEEG